MLKLKCADMLKHTEISTRKYQLIKVFLASSERKINFEGPPLHADQNCYKTNSLSNNAFFIFSSTSFKWSYSCKRMAICLHCILNFEFSIIFWISLPHFMNLSSTFYEFHSISKNWRSFNFQLTEILKYLKTRLKFRQF